MTETSANDSFLDDIGLIAPLYDLDFLAFPREDIDFYVCNVLVLRTSD